LAVRAESNVVERIFQIEDILQPLPARLQAIRFQQVQPPLTPTDEQPAVSAERHTGETGSCGDKCRDRKKWTLPERRIH
jgi:hypothetical protein